MNEMKFSELGSCPFCGSEEYVTKNYVYGTTYCGERFDGKECHNEELYDGLNCKNYSGRAYCRNCGKYLGNKETNTLSKQVQKEFVYFNQSGIKKGDEKK